MQVLVGGTRLRPPHCQPHCQSQASEIAHRLGGTWICTGEDEDGPGLEETITLWATADGDIDGPPRPDYQLWRGKWSHTADSSQITIRFDQVYQDRSIARWTAQYDWRLDMLTEGRWGGLVVGTFTATRHPDGAGPTNLLLGAIPPPPITAPTSPPSGKRPLDQQLQGTKRLSPAAPLAPQNHHTYTRRSTQQGLSPGADMMQCDETTAQKDQGSHGEHPDADSKLCVSADLSDKKQKKGDDQSSRAPGVAIEPDQVEDTALLLARQFSIHTDADSTHEATTSTEKVPSEQGCGGVGGAHRINTRSEQDAREELMQTFIECTMASRAEAEQILEGHAWQVEEATATFFGFADITAGVAAPAPNAPLSAATAIPAAANVTWNLRLRGSGLAPDAPSELLLPAGSTTTLTELSALVCASCCVAAERLMIRTGFPPKVLNMIGLPQSQTVEQAGLRDREVLCVDQITDTPSSDQVKVSANAIGSVNDGESDDAFDDAFDDVFGDAFDGAMEVSDGPAASFAPLAPKEPSIFPEYWTQSEESKPVCIEINRTESSKGSDEWEMVLQRIRANRGSANILDGIDIVSVTRVQNKTRWRQFMAEKDQMDCRENDVVGANMQWLWHGTGPETVPCINRNGFDRSFTKTAQYGKGVYFAQDFEYSSHPRYAKPGDDGVQHAYLARVLVGHTTVGVRHMDHPPLRDVNAGLRFDCLVNPQANAAIYVSCHNDNQAYPEYLVKFKKRSEYAG